MPSLLFFTGCQIVISLISDVCCLFLPYIFVKIDIDISILLFLKIQISSDVLFLYIFSPLLSSSCLLWVFFFFFYLHFPFLIVIYNHLLIYYYSQPFPISNESIWCHKLSSSTDLGASHVIWITMSWFSFSSIYFAISFEILTLAHWLFGHMFIDIYKFKGFSIVFLLLISIFSPWWKRSNSLVSIFVF